MPRKKTIRPESMDEAIKTSEILQVHWPLFKQFQTDIVKDTKHPGHALAAIVTQIMDENEAAAMALFGAGLAAGMHFVFQAFQEAHEMVAVEEMMAHVPDKNRPRA